MPIKKILVANRSEIAIRVFRAANELNILRGILSAVQGRRGQSMQRPRK